MRRSAVKTKVSYSLSKLDDLAKAQEWEGGALDNLSKILDSIIDSKLPADFAALTPGELAGVELQQGTDDALSAAHDPNQQLSEYDKEIAEIRARQTKSPTMSKELEELVQSPIAWGAVICGILVVVLVRRSMLKKKLQRAEERSRSKGSRSRDRSQRNASDIETPQHGASIPGRTGEEPENTAVAPSSKGSRGAPSRVSQGTLQASLAANKPNHEPAAPLGEMQTAARPARNPPKAACIRNYRSR